MVARLARILGPAHLDLAEESVQDALLRALKTWPYQGVPENPGGWLYRVAYNSAIDAVRRAKLRGEPRIVAELTRSANASPSAWNEPTGDDELRMIFLCCHPALARETSVALSLKTVSGLSVREIARAFLVDPEAITQRLVRAKRQIRDQGIRLDMPQGDELARRLDTVLDVIYFLFNEGYAAHEGDDLVRQDLCAEALRLGRLLAASPLAIPKVHALVALMAFQAARLPARTDAAGDLVLLEAQDRRRWDQQLLALGFHHFDLSIRGQEVSAYHAQAAIAATHARALDPAATDWPLLLELYDQLLALSPSPVVALNRAVVLCKVKGPAAALRVVAALQQEPRLRGYYLLPAVRGQLLRELGRHAEAAACFQDALALPCSAPERRFLEQKLAACVAPPATGP
jgi:RNA polymerase sigma-70 factor (ECF subfamily)